MKTQAVLAVVFRDCLLLMALVLALGLSFGNLRGAIWQGGPNYWASDNWGMPDQGYPGDPNNLTEEAIINTADSEVIIKEGDYLGTNFFATVTAGSIRQTGGVWINQGRITIHTRYDHLGGTITGNTMFWVADGGTWLIDGGELGTRMDGHDGLPAGGSQSDCSLFFYNLGGKVTVTERGIVDIHTFNSFKYLYQPDGEAIVEATGVVSSGKSFDRSALFWVFSKKYASQTVIARFIFTEEGFTPWWCQGYNALNFGTGDLRGDLEVDVGAYKDLDGATPHPLFIYRYDMPGDISFGNVKIIDDIHGELVPGEAGDLQPGEYCLDYFSTEFHKTMKAITLNFRNPPWPSGTVITIR